MARAKQTGRAEARRRYRISTTEAAAETTADEGAELDFGERRPDAGPGRRKEPTAASQGAAAGRPSFLGAFRAAYNPAHPREDIAAIPMLLRSRAFLAGVGLVLIGAIAAYFFPGYNGSAFAWELLVWPGSALAPQLVAGFFAPRASYILGLFVGLIQGIVFSIFLTQFASRLGTQLPSDQLSSLLTVSFLTGPFSGALFASAAAWYRRFLALSNPRRAQAGRGRAQGGRSQSKSQARRPAGR